MPDRPWRDDEEDWSETGGDYNGDDGDGDFDDDGSLPCPECGAAIYDDLDHCPKCGFWLTDSDRRGHDTGVFRDRNLRIVAAIALAAFLLAVLGGVCMF